MNDCAHTDRITRLFLLADGEAEPVSVYHDGTLHHGWSDLAADECNALTELLDAPTQDERHVVAKEMCRRWRLWANIGRDNKDA